MSRTLLLLISAALVGASGLGLEVLAIDLAGLTLGYGRSGPVALALFIAGWSSGAWLSSTWHGGLARKAAGLGVWLLLAGALLPFGFQSLAQANPGEVLAWLGSALFVLSIALPQGALLPLFARGLGGRGGRDLSALFAANLLGAAVGAWGFGSWLPANHGRVTASLAAGACALLAALVAAWVLNSAKAGSRPDVARLKVPLRIGVGVALGTAWVATLEWFGVRLGVLWLGGMQESLVAILVSSLIALSLGAALLPRLLPNSERGIAALLVLCTLGSGTYFYLPELLAGSQGQSVFVRSMWLVGPALFPFGAWIPMWHRRLDDPDGEALGTLLGFEALGALVGLPLMHFGLLPLIGLGGCVLLMGGLALLALFLRGPRDWVLATGALGLATFLLNFSKQGAPALASPPLQNPAFEILAFEEDQHFAISVVQDGLLGERTLLTDGFRAAANGRDYDYMRALAHLPLLLHPNPERVGVLAFGTGTTAGAVSLHTEPQHIDVLELSSTVTDYAHWFEEANRGVLQDSRVQVWIGDGRHTLRGKQGVYDVLTMEPLLPDSPFAVYLYTTEFYGVVRQSLAPGGLVCQWVPPHALAPKTFDAVLSAFTSAFEWSGIWVFGTQVILLGGEQAPQPDRGRFGGGSPVLRSALAGLGLQDLEGVLARYVVPGSDWPAAQRPLTDLDPWVIYAGRRKGSLLLADLPLNLAKLRKHAQPIPLEWSIGLGAGATSRMQALAYLREAREAFEGARASAAIGTQAQNGDSELLAAHGRLLQECSQADVDSLLTEVRRRAPQEAGLLRFEASLEFQTEIRRGFALLSGANSQEAAGQAAVHLTRAVVLRPERADVHAYLAVALARLGSDRSKLELEKARELCPNLAETPVGRRLVQLGL